MSDNRADFQKLRNRWMKEHGWKGFVCARCGYFGKSVHLHHLVELVYGGDNTPENLIPLCSECHREWDNYPEEYPFEQFLVTMPSRVLPMIPELCAIHGAQIFPTRAYLALLSSVFRAVNMTKTGHVLEEDGIVTRDLMWEQNDFFSKYPYSDEKWREGQLRSVYGDLSPIPVKENSCRA